MRTLAVLLLLSCSSSMAQESLLNEARRAVAETFRDEAVSSAMTLRFEGVDVSQSPLLMGYKGAVVMAQGRHASNPFRKLGIFNEGKAMLDAAIRLDPASVELRFLRLTIQVNVPGILGYSGQIAEDRAFIDRHLSDAGDEAFRSRVRNFIAKAEEQGKL